MADVLDIFDEVKPQEVTPPTAGQTTGNAVRDALRAAARLGAKAANPINAPSARQGRAFGAVANAIGDARWPAYLRRALEEQGYTFDADGNYTPPNAALTDADFQEGVRRIGEAF